MGFGTGEAPPPECSRALISDALARIAAYADTGSVDDYVARFTADATWKLSVPEGFPLASMMLTGAAQIRASVAERRSQGVQGPGTHTAHQVSSTYVDFDPNHPGVAVAHSLFCFFTEIHSAPKLRSVGRYTDTFEWRGGEWLLHQRIIVQE